MKIWGSRVPSRRWGRVMRICHPSKVRSTYAKSSKLLTMCCAVSSTILLYLVPWSGMYWNMSTIFTRISCSLAVSMKADATMSLRILTRDTGKAALYCLHVTMLILLDSIEMHQTSIARFEWPNGSYWTNEYAEAKAKVALAAAH